MDEFIKETINECGLFTEGELQWLMEHFDLTRKCFLLGVIDAK